MKLESHKIKIYLKCKKLPIIVMSDDKHFDELSSLMLTNDVIVLGELIFLKSDVRYIVYD